MIKAVDVLLFLYQWIALHGTLAQDPCGSRTFASNLTMS